MKKFKWPLFLSALVGLLYAAKPKSSPDLPMNIHEYSFKTIDGEEQSLLDFKGKKILFVNVASKCGFTPQYEGLEELSQTYKDKLVVLGFPCNQFGKQEPGDAEEIKGFCKKNYGVTFLLSEKIDVKGDNTHDIYHWLTSKDLNGISNSSVKWNFQKYLVDEEGKYLDSYLSTTTPMSSSITDHLK